MPSTQHLNHQDPVSDDPGPVCPIIDIGDLMSRRWRKLVPAAQESCRRNGFMCLEVDAALHGTISASLGTARAFFASNSLAKAAVAAADGEYGWTPSGAEPAYQPGTVSNVESFDVTRPMLDGRIDCRWPAVDSFAPAATACWTSLRVLANLLLELLGRSAEIVPDFLRMNCDSGELDTLRMLRYPPESRPVGQGEVGIAAHTDFECITLLYETAPGLELRDPRGHWRPAPTGDDRLIVLLGDMLEIWTNGYFQATGHRVRRTMVERFSAVMFVAANRDVCVRPLNRFISPQCPARYDAVGQEAHIEAELAKARSQQALAAGPDYR